MPKSLRYVRWPLASANAIAIGVCAAAAGLGAVLSSGAPTGTQGWDAVLKFALAAWVVAAVSKAPRWVAIVFASVGAVFAGSPGWFAVAALAQLIAIAPAVFRRRNRLFNAVSAALAIQALLRLPDIWFFGFPSLVAGAAIVLALFHGYRYSTSKIRKVARRATIGVTVAAVLIGLLGGLSLVSARSDVERGVFAARRGLSAARSADTSAIVAELEEAEGALVAAESKVDSPRAQLLRLIPIAAQHHRAISVATEEGVAVARLAAATVRDADIETIRLDAGAVDVAALAVMASQLDETATALETAAERIEVGLSPWLLPAVADRIDELLDEIADVAPEARLAADGAAVLPAMLGADGPRQYFVMFGTPAESREMGGLLGSWALLRFEDGRMTKVDDGRIRELIELARSGSLDRTQYPQWYFDSANVLDWPQNLTGTPDMSLAAMATRELFGGPDGLQIDGVIYLDTWAVVELLELTGPVEVGFQPEALTRKNGADFFFDGQYRLDSTRNETFEELSEALDAVLLRLTTVELPGPEPLGKVLGPAARGGHLQVVTFDDTENAFLRRTLVLRNFARPESGDAFALIQTNADSDKLDLYVHRDVTYDVTVHDEGVVAGTVTVELDLRLPDDPPEFVLGVETPGEGVELLSLYTPHIVTEVRVDGVVTQFAFTREYDYGRILVTVPTRPDRPTVVEYVFEGALDPDEPYTLHIWHQPLVNDDQVHVRYSGPDGDHSADYTLVENVVFTPRVTSS